MTTGRGSRALVGTLLSAGLLLAASGSAQNRADTEAKLTELAREIEALQATLSSARGTLSAEQQALREIDRDLQNRTERLARARSERLAQSGRVQALEAEQQTQLQQLAAREEALSQQLLSAWKMSRQSRLRLIMSQQDPARLTRLLGYYDRLNEAQSESISELQSALTALQDVQERLTAELTRLSAIEEEQQRAERQLQDKRSEQRANVEQLQARLSTDEARLQELLANRRDLETLLERLDDALADIPDDLGGRLAQAPARGQLQLPVAGPVRAAFGQSRGGGMRWQGWLIAAPAGTEVRSVAYGRVAYADWLRGYGLLLILDHGEGFMSLYGRNESLRVAVGDWVEAGGVIATSGRGTDQREGLYFELRREGKAVDPANWVQR